MNCGFNLLTGAKVQTQVVAGAPKTKKKKKVAAAKGPGMGKGEFTSFAQRRILADDPEEIAAKARWNDIYWPTIALSAGLVLSIVDGAWGLGVSDFKYVIAFVMLTSIFNVILSFIGVLITSKLLSIGLGTIPTALLKVSAIALAPGAISSILSNKFESGWVFGWIISVVLYYLMFYKFFDMDMLETMLCSVIIWVMRTWLVYFLVGAILAGIGFGRFGGAGGLGDDDEDAPARHTKPGKTPQNMKQKAPASDQSDEGAMLYPIGDKAMVFFDSAGVATYHLGAGVVPV